MFFNLLQLQRRATSFSTITSDGTSGWPAAARARGAAVGQAEGQSSHNGAAGTDRRSHADVPASCSCFSCAPSHHHHHCFRPACYVVAMSHGGLGRGTEGDIGTVGRYLAAERTGPGPACRLAQETRTRTAPQPMHQELRSTPSPMTQGQGTQVQPSGSPLRPHHCRPPESKHSHHARYHNSPHARRTPEECQNNARRTSEERQKHTGGI